jgi:hypothetical protein
MRTSLSFLVVAVLAIVLVTGCSGKQVSSVDRDNLPANLAEAPDWVFQPQVKGKLAAVGSAPKSSGGMQFQRNEAMASARDELARMVSVNVRNMFQSFQEATGIGDAETFDRVSTNVSKQVTNQTLVGSRQDDIWVDPEGTMYLLAVLDPKTVGAAVKEAARVSMDSAEALYQQMKAKEAFDDLDEQIDRVFGD